MHKSTGNAIELDEALDRMGADVMRWLYCAQTPSEPLRFGFALADDVKRRFLTFWNSVKFFVDYANIAGFRPSWSALEPEGELAPLDRWLVARTHEFVLRRRGRVRALRHGRRSMRAYEAYADDLSNWYIRRSRRRFWNGEHAALETLWYALVQTLRVMAPVMPFVTDHLWRVLVPDGPESVHLAAWPEVAEPDRALLDEIADVRRVVTLAHQARAASGLKLRQPLRRLVVEGAGGAQAHADEIADEVRVKEVVFEHVDAELRVKPNLPVLGPRLGKELRAVQQALAGRRVRGARRRPLPRSGPRARAGRGARRARRPRGLAGRGADGMTVALDTRSTTSSSSRAASTTSSGR